MATRITTIRTAMLLGWCVLLATSPLPAIAQLLNPAPISPEPMPDATQSLLSDNYPWDVNVISDNQPELVPPAFGDAESGALKSEHLSVRAATDNDAESLAKRVEALEEYVHQQKSASSVESLPSRINHDAADRAESTSSDKCAPTKIDTIVAPTFQPHGRILFDGVTYDDGQATKEFFDTDRNNELGFSALRLGGNGDIYENLIYKIEVDFRGTNSAISFRDIYMEQQSLPYIGHFRAGHFKEPIGMEEFQSSLYLTFMERSPATHAFAPARNFGMMVWDTTDQCQDTSWFAGLFRADSPASPTNTGEWRSDNNDWCFDSRVAWLPYYDEPSNGRYLVHLGGSYSFRHVGALTPTATYNQNAPYSTLNGLAEFSTRSWVGTQAPIGFGAEADSNQWNQINPEFLVIWGPASLQAEYYQVLMTSGEQFNGGYALLSYFLTGENRSYRKDLKVVDRTEPFEPFFWVNTARGRRCGWGAWEVAAGYSWVNLDDGHDTVVATPPNSTDRLRGFYDTVVFGVNWYQNARSRVFIDYEHEVVNFVDAGVPNSNANIFGIRWQVDW